MKIEKRVAIEEALLVKANRRMTLRLQVQRRGADRTFAGAGNIDEHVVGRSLMLRAGSSRSLRRPRGLIGSCRAALHSSSQRRRGRAGEGKGRGA